MDECQLVPSSWVHRWHGTWCSLSRVRYEEPEAQEVPIIYGTYSCVRIGSCQNFGSILFCSRCQNMAPSEANFKVELRRTNEEKRKEKSHMMAVKIPSSQYYNEYHGHKVQHLSKIYPLLRESSDALIWTAGDSSLDNKYW